MGRIYKIEWYEKKDLRRRGPQIRTTMIRLSKPTNEVSIDAKTAVELFTVSCGNLRKNEIVRIKEFDDEGNQIGEDIVPQEGENAIVPTGR